MKKPYRVTNKLIDSYHKDETSYQSMASQTNFDFCAALILYKAAFLNGPFRWLVMHSLEKYMKALLLKLDPDYKPREDSHRILQIWEKIEEKQSALKMKHFQDYREYFKTFLEELSSIDPQSRYGGSSYTSYKLIGVYVLMANYLRYHIYGTERYQKNYGLIDLGNEMMNPEIKPALLSLINTITECAELKLMDSNKNFVFVTVPDFLRENM